MFRFFRLISLVLFLTSASSLSFGMSLFHHGRNFTYEDQLHYKIALYKRDAYRDLAPYFSGSGLTHMPEKLALLVFKADKRLELWGREQHVWKHIRDYPVLAASGHAGPKLREFDRQVPEGIYRITALNPNSLFHLSMRVNYPNAYDRQHAKQEGRTHLGGDIFIHGSNLSIGCIAVGDHNINQLFVLAYQVGIKNIRVIIAPNDLRVSAPAYSKNSPPWTRELYDKIKTALLRYPKTYT